MIKFERVFTCGLTGTRCVIVLRDGVEYCVEIKQVMDKVLRLDIQNMIADYENDRITDHELIDFLKEITAE